ncbi:PAS domain S-box protein [Desulfovibrio sulfodismutans]|uniref:histidine kinase n=1 Tax=Desulfolutivibrio sulfodismutans TaxID=63561 RepID=A0A7K3NHG5_9BACT|nr:CHASE4 domain-containing protein [Desulfolutivibrio sulfodismutans]NDY55641.1 PAS domain S-box protein [Desulfolutivibrio sulfodismutans]QLA11661.1 PAS domain S-box protein [Desulfolutivibrio sulfodismutans DSM 3696]
MGLRRATILLTGLTLAVLLVALYATSRFIILDRFLSLENEITRQNVERGVNALMARLAQLGLLATDWANWDDAYAFVVEPGEEFVQSNLTPETFVHQNLDIILFFDVTGSVVWGKFREPGQLAPEPLSPPLREICESAVQRLSGVEDGAPKDGILLLPQGAYLVAIHPLLKSDATGPHRGYLLMGSHFGDMEVSRLSQLTRLDLSFSLMSTASLDAKTADALRTTDGPVPVVKTSPGDTETAGYALIRDLFGEPALLLSLAMPRDIYRQGQDMLRYTLAAIFLAGLAFAAVLLAFLERRVISRLGILERQAGTIGVRHAGERRVALSGNDELARLSDSINDMLDRLEKTQEALEISEGKYRSLFLNTATAMILVNTETSLIELVNAEFERLSGFSREEVEHRKNWKDFTLDFDALAIEDFFRRRAGAERPLPGSIDCRFLGRDQDIRYVSLTVAMIAGTDMCIVSMIDLTDRKRAEEALAEFSRKLERLVAERTSALEDKARELVEANKRLLELDRLKSAFLSSVSHELRTPLTSIRGFASLIRKDLARLGKTSQGVTGKYVRIDGNLSIIIKESDRLTMLLNDFLDLSKIESGRMEWRDTRLPVADLVARGVDAVRGLFEEKHSICLALDVPDDLPDIYADPDRMLQVLINLLSNAAKFTDKGVVRIMASRDGDGLRLTVSDEGMGVPKEDLESIFGKFRQSAQGDILENKPRGTGLGLAICRNIIRHYGGRIWAESEVGRGSSFHIFLPGGRLASRVGGSLDGPDTKTAAPS